jgi:hypothetical protein
VTAALLDRALKIGKERRGRKLQRCVKACFCDDNGKLTFEGERVLADLRERSKLFGSAVRRDGRGVIDRDDLLRIEGRREIVLRLLNLLELDPLGVARLMEVDDA